MSHVNKLRPNKLLMLNKLIVLKDIYRTVANERLNKPKPGFITLLPIQMQSMEGSGVKQKNSKDKVCSYD